MQSRLILGAGIAAMMAAGTAFATPVFVGHIFVNDSYGATGGGEFRVQGQGDFALNPLSTGTAFQGGIPAAAGLFESFCVEKFETIDFSVQDYKADVNTETVAQNAAYAGGAHGGFNDPLDARTAYLYHNFLAHSLSTPYDYVNEGNRINDADAMQTAMWFIEQEDATPLTGKALALYNEANNAVNGGAWVGIGNVRILNVYTNTARVDYQDILIETSSVPLPAGASLASLGLAGIGMVRRRANK